MDKQLINAIHQLREQNTKNHNESVLVGEYLREEVEDNTKMLSDLLKEMRGSRLDAEEERRERNRASQGKGPSGKAEDTKKKDEDLFSLSNAFKALGGIGVGLAGIATGFLPAYGKVLTKALAGVTSQIDAGAKKFVKGPTFTKANAKVFTPIASTLDDISKKFEVKRVDFTKTVGTRIDAVYKSASAPFRALDDVFSKRGTGQFLKGDTIKTLGSTRSFFESVAKQVSSLEKTFKSVTAVLGENFTKGLTSIRTTVSNVGQSISNTQKAISGFNFTEGFQNIVDTFKPIIERIKRPFEGISKYFEGISKTVGRLGGFFKTVFSAFAAVGRFIALPLTIITAAIDGIRGLMKGVEEQEGIVDKTIGGAIGTIMGVLSGLIAMPLDLLKGAVSWIAGKLGFENFEEMLDSFSFVETFDRVRVALTEGIIKAFDRVQKVFEDLWASIKAPFDQGFSFTALTEFVITLPMKIYNGLLDLVKAGISSVLDLMGFSETSDAIDNFSFTDQFLRVWNWVKGLPTKLVDKVMSWFGSYETPSFDFGGVFTRAVDYVTGLPSRLVDNVMSWFNGYEIPSFDLKGTFTRIVDWVVALPSKLVDSLVDLMGNISVSDLIGSAMQGALDMADRFNQFLKGIVAPYLASISKMEGIKGRAARLATPSWLFEWAGVNEKTGEILRPSIPTTTATTSAQGEMQQKSAENAAAGSAPPPVVIADSSSKSETTVNNTTLAAMGNTPTQDNNDRSWVPASL